MWRAELRNNLILKLPEKNIYEALKNYNNINSSFSNHNLNDIESIDLRLENKAIIKYKN